MATFTDPPTSRVLQDSDPISALLHTHHLPRELEAATLTWRLPAASPPLPAHAHTTHIRLHLPQLLTPSSRPFETAKHPSERTAADHHLPCFRTTPALRAIRDLKRPHSWKLHGLRLAGRPPHYLRLSFLSRANHLAFARAAAVLTVLALRREPGAPRAFGVGGAVWTGAPEEWRRVYVLTHCAKLTPGARGVRVEVCGAGWRRAVDRVGVAVYESARCGGVRWCADPWVRFPRVTLRFGGVGERVLVDVEGVRVGGAGGGGSWVALEGRVWVAGRPVRAAVRLVFWERGGAGGERAAVEAGKFVRLVGRALEVAGRNSWGIPGEVRDDEVFAAGLRGVASQKGYVVASADSCSTLDIGGLFVDGEFVAYRSPKGGIVLVSQSQCGDVLRQHLEKTSEVLSAITPGGFASSALSTLVRADGTSGIGAGVLYYNFKSRSAEGKRFAEWLKAVSGSRSEPPAVETTSLPEKKGIIPKITRNVSLSGTKTRGRLYAEEDVQDGGGVFTHSRSCSNTSVSSTSSTGSFFNLISWTNKHTKREAGRIQQP